jgi:hypothetical protein
MATRLDDNTLRELAVAGLNVTRQELLARLSELDAIAERLKSGRTNGRSATAAAVTQRSTTRGRRGATARATAVANDAPRRSRPRMTAAQRKQVSERMRKYWAERRKEKA